MLRQDPYAIIGRNPRAHRRGQTGGAEMEAERETPSWGSILCVFLASLCFSTGGLGVKLIPWSALAINGARNLIGAGVIGLWLLLRRHRPLRQPLPSRVKATN